MPDPIPGNDPNAAYDVIPSQDWPHGWTVVAPTMIRSGPLARPRLK
jgi:hypothetical protein